MKRKTEIHGNKKISRNKRLKVFWELIEKCFFEVARGCGHSKDPLRSNVYFFRKLARSKYDPGKWSLQAIFGGH
jgi:hypothetical protein